MKTPIYLGIDMGSSSLKAVAVDGVRGTTLALAGAALPYLRTPDGGCVLAERDIRDTLARVLGDVGAQLGPRAGDVAAASCTGHGAGLYLLDARGALLGGHGCGSTDQRGAARALAVGRQHGDALFAEVGSRPWAGQPTLIAAERRAADATALAGATRLLFAKDYLAFLLTGEVATDFSDASTAGLIALDSGAWSHFALDAAGVAEALAPTLSRIMPSGGPLGPLQPAQAAAFGLPAGIPVAMGAIDLLATVTAVGALQPGHAVAVLGTWCVNVAIGPSIEPKPGVSWIVATGVPGQRLYMENSPSSMANLAWCADALRFDDAHAVIDAAMSAPPGAHGVRFLPFVNGGGDPPAAAAGFLGVKRHHTRADLARAVVEAVVALHVRHLQRLAAAGLPLSRVSAAGGGARDERLVGLLAAMLDRPVDRFADDETGARGGAMYAAATQGLAPDAAEHPLRMQHERVAPSAAEVRAYVGFGARFDALLDTVGPALVQIDGHAQ